MSAWQNAFTDLDRACINTFGQAVQYSRPESANFSAIPSFSLCGLLNTSGQYADPLGQIYGAFFIVAADVPGGPQKGDLIQIGIDSASIWLQSTPLTYIVKEVCHDAGEGWARLMLRWSGQ